MDLQVRYWDNNEMKLCMRYLKSHFLKRPNALNFLDVLLLSLKDLIPERLVQLSMDGSSTKWKVLSFFMKTGVEKDIHPLLTLVLVAYMLTYL